LTSLPDGAVVPIYTAVVTSLIAVLGLIISKENKTSEFRQTWVDSLREEIAGVVGHMNAIIGSVRNAGHSEKGWLEARDNVTEINRCIAGIRLRLNPSERRSQVMFQILDEMELLFVRGGPLPEEKTNKIEKTLIVEGQAILKEEWLRVRGGEFFYKLTRAAAITVLVVSAIALVSLVFSR
jgi:hypothetical protein